MKRSTRAVLIILAVMFAIFGAAVAWAVVTYGGSSKSDERANAPPDDGENKADETYTTVDPKIGGKCFGLDNVKRTVLGPASCTAQGTNGTWTQSSNIKSLIYHQDVYSACIQTPGQATDSVEVSLYNRGDTTCGGVEIVDKRIQSVGTVSGKTLCIQRDVLGDASFYRWDGCRNTPTLILD